jgi:hypothetical protein
VASVILSDHRVPVGGLLEVLVEGLPQTGDRIDEEGRVQIRQPDGSIVQADLFVARSFEESADAAGEPLRPAGPLHYRCRFSPRIEGEHELTLLCDGTSEAPVRFEAEAAEAAPFVRARGNWLAFEDGRPFLVIGTNLLLPHGEHMDYEAFLRTAAEANLNTIRVVLPACKDGQPGPLNPWQPGKGPLEFRLEELWRLDRLFELAGRHGLHVILALLDHAAFAQPEPDGHGWFWNPFNVANGGPCETPDEFFTSPAAFNVFGAWLRYFAARYGAFSNLLAWELLHEFDRVPLETEESGREEILCAWHRKAAGLLRLADPCQHLITSSAWWFRGGHQTFQLPQLTLAQTHYAVDSEPSADLSEECYYISERRRRDYRKPYLIGAFGVHAGHGPEDREAAEVCLRNGLWASAMACTAGPALPAVELDERMLQAFRILGQFLRRGALDPSTFFSERWTECDGRLMVYAMGNEKESYLWLRNVAYTWQSVLRDRLVHPTPSMRLALGWHPPGEYAVEIWDTREGLRRSDRISVTRRGLLVPVPKVSADLAVRVQQVRADDGGSA